MSLEELRKEGLKWVEVNKSERFSGIKKILTDNYPDNAHFIYELLQNAEDAHDKEISGSSGASQVYFNLKRTSLEFEHNGDRLFNLKDIESITGIGYSSKLDDTTSIGEFGIGFKAVFSYTNTPEIHSGEFNFKIHDFVVPETDGVPILDLGKKTTRFIFPFDNPKKPVKKAVAEIEKGLQALQENTLLFLSNIRKIEYRLPDGSTGLLERVDIDNFHIEIRSKHPNGKESVSHWLRFEKTVEVTDDVGKNKTCRIAVAYSMVEDKETKKNRVGWKIVPLDHGQVSIYFPTEREIANLRFHLHAPFATTSARAFVQSCPGNDALRDYLAKLISESLQSIKKMGMLNVSFLAVLPNPYDNIPEFYKPIRQTIVQAFSKNKLVPTRSGSYASSKELYLGDAKIADVLGDDGVEAITGYSPPLWAASPPPQHQHAKHFLESLEIDKWGWNELIESFNMERFFPWVPDKEKQHRIESWIQSLKDERIQKLYALLGEAYTYRSQSRHPYSALNIIRVTIPGNGVEHVTARQAYLQAVDEILPPPDIKCVKPELYSKGRSEEQKKYALMFLQHLGIRSFDEKDAILRRRDFYANPPSRPPKEYLKDIEKFIELCRNTPKELDNFKELPFLRGRVQNETVHWLKPYELYLDQPYIDSGLDEFFSDDSFTLEKRKTRILDDYKKIPGFVDFAERIGVMTKFEIRKSTATHIQENEFQIDGSVTSTTINDDHYINGLYWQCETSPYFLGRLNIKVLSVSKVVWKTMGKASPEQLVARYMPNARNRNKEKTSNSYVICYLRDRAWIPDKSGAFKKPADITKEELHPDFQPDDRNGWLTAIGLGENIRKRSEEYQAIDAVARDIGFTSADRAAKWAELDKAGIDPDELLTKQKSPELPEASVVNPERRRKRMVDDSYNTPDKESVLRERSVQPWIDGDTGKAKAYLRSLYVNGDDEIVCQCCRHSMPFKVKELHYFEAIQCIKDLKKRCIENRLALCPTCAAMFQYARDTEDLELRNRIINLTKPETSPSVEIPMTLAGKEHQFYFVGKHWFDLKTILEVQS